MRKIFSLMLLFMIFLSTVVDASDEFCASLRNIKGEVVIERNGQTLATKAGTHVFPNDSIRTGPDSSVGIIFVDNSRISLGPNSRLDLKEFVFKPNEGKFSMVNKLSKGTASFVSGKMTKLSPESVVLETPSSTIGIRGTTFNVKVND
jgi:Uncharacterized protein conserved in bacteria